MSYLFAVNRIPQHLNDMGLANEFVKSPRTKFSSGDLIFHVLFAIASRIFTRNDSHHMIYRLGSFEWGLGDPAAHRLTCLPLLPSGSGGVHKILLHRAQPLFNGI